MNKRNRLKIVLQNLQNNKFKNFERRINIKTVKNQICNRKFTYFPTKMYRKQPRIKVKLYS